MVEELVAGMLGADGKRAKLTSLKTIYIYLRDNRLCPKGRKHLSLIFYSPAKVAQEGG